MYTDFDRQMDKNYRLIDRQIYRETDKKIKK